MPNMEEWLKFLGSPNRATRVRAAIDLLQNYPEEVPTDVVLRIFQDFEPTEDEIRALIAGTTSIRRGPVYFAGYAVGAAQRLLLERAEHSLFEPMVDILLNETDPFRRVTACQILGKIGNRAALPHLIAALRDDSMNVQNSAIWALEKFKEDGEQVTQALSKRYLDASYDPWDLRMSLEFALKRLGVIKDS